MPCNEVRYNGETAMKVKIVGKIVQKSISCGCGAEQNTENKLCSFCNTTALSILVVDNVETMDEVKPNAENWDVCEIK